MSTAWIPRPDQMLQCPELAALAGLVAQLELASRAVMAAHPEVWHGDRPATSWSERRTAGIQIRAHNLRLDIEDYLRLRLAGWDPVDIATKR